MDQEPTVVPPNGAEPNPAAPSPVDPADYLARARSDPEFAVAEITKHQSAARKASNELKSFAPLKDIVSKLEGGSATAAQLIYEQAAILQHPEVRSVVEHYRKFGTLPTTPTAQRSDASDDIYQDPMDLLRSEVTELRTQLGQLLGQSRQDRSLFAQTAMQSHLQTLKTKYQDVWSFVEPKILEQAEAWERTPHGRDYLAGATFDTWDNIAKIALGDNLDAVVALRAQKRVQSQEGLGTEPSPTNVTTGRETPVRREETWRPGSARKVIEDLRRREGRSV